MVGTDLAVPASDTAARSLVGWAEQLGVAMQLAKALCATSFAPASFRGKPEEAAAAILRGHGLGFDPMESLDAFFVISGRVGMYTKRKVALLISNGHEVWTEESSDTSVTVCGRRKGSNRVEKVTLGIEDAKRAGWTSNATYAKTPADMLYARAASRLCDRVAPDVLMGIPSVEDIEDLPPIQATATVRHASELITPKEENPPWQTSQSPTPAEPMASPRTPDEPTSTSPTPADDESPLPEQRMSGPQQRKLFGLLRDTGREDRDVALVYISGVLGREVTSTKELGRLDAARVIDALETRPADPAADYEEPTLTDDWPQVAGVAR